MPAGAVVRLAVGSANRDERVFSEPDRFRPDRPDLHRGKELRSAQISGGRSGHLSFGAGAHFCIGYELARVESIALSRALLSRLKALHFADLQQVGQGAYAVVYKVRRMEGGARGGGERRGAHAIRSNRRFFFSIRRPDKANQRTPPPPFP